jgi:purine catabolism regulator
MAFTLSEALTMECLKNARVIAGKQGLYREIRFVNVMEVPDIVDWVSEDEFLLTTGYPFKDSSTSFVDLIKKLSGKKLTGLAVKTRRFLEGLPEEAINIANKFNFPIIELPPDAHFDKIIRDLLAEVINRDYLIIKRTEQIHQTFTSLVLSGGEFQEVAFALANLCYARVQIINVFDEVLAEAEPQKERNKNLENILGNRGETENGFIQRPVFLNNEIFANITMNILGRSVESEDIVAIERAATIVALVLLKKQAAAEVEKNIVMIFSMIL